jgi:hypothetical protein
MFLVDDDERMLFYYDGRMRNVKRRKWGDRSRVATKILRRQLINCPT